MPTKQMNTQIITEVPQATGFTAAANRFAPAIKWISIALIVIAVIVLVRTLPVSTGVDRLKTWVEGFGVLGTVVFGGVYIGAAMLFVPGSALTLASGALFGWWVGTAVVSIASTTAAALSFLAARYLARQRVAAQAQRFPRFRAIDEAIGQGGAKIVALLRLSPAVPFSLGNYLFGLTGIRFVSYVLASWLFMLPGTFMYVYFGYAAAQGLEAAGGGQGGKSPAQWAAMVVGLLATVAVTIYVTKLAKRAIRAQTDIDGTEAAASTETASGAPAESHGWPWGATVAALLAALFVSGAAWAKMNQETLAGMFGPPRANLMESYKKKAGGATFDHSRFDALLHKYVDDRGLVDYAGLKGQSAALDGYIKTLATAPFDDMGRDEKLALLINAYNAFTLRLILDHYPVKSVRDIKGNWTEARWTLAGHTFSLNDIEHKQIRSHFKEPRIHFALVCAAIGCPRLRAEAYVADRLEAQLQDQARYAHSHPRWLVYDREAGVVHLTSLYNWYGSDFIQASGSLLNFARKYSNALDGDLTAGKKVDVRFLGYDWDLNSQKNAAKIGN